VHGLTRHATEWCESRTLLIGGAHSSGGLRAGRASRASRGAGSGEVTSNSDKAVVGLSSVASERNNTSSTRELTNTVSDRANNAERDRTVLASVRRARRGVLEVVVLSEVSAEREVSGLRVRSELDSSAWL
jgi:hypothetical protein